VSEDSLLDAGRKTKRGAARRRHVCCSGRTCLKVLGAIETPLRSVEKEDADTADTIRRGMTGLQ
jgi:hypothetical protein